MNTRIIRVKSRLSSLAVGRGGVPQREAVRAAEKLIDCHAEELLATVDVTIAELERRFGVSSPDGAVGDYEGLYLLASRIIDIAVCLRGSYVDKAAYALCDLADLSSELKVWDRQAVEIHIMVLRLLRQVDPTMSETRRRGMVDGLFKVAAKRIGQMPATKIH